MRDPMNDNNNTDTQTPKPTMSDAPTASPRVTDNNTRLAQASAGDTRTEIYQPTRPTILYNALLDDSPIAAKKTIPTDTLTGSEPQPVKRYAKEIISDNQILTQSHQLIASDDRLEGDNNATGQLIEQLGVSAKQWQLALSWQRTRVPKAGLINQLKKRTELLDIDLSCLLCNRYGEVLESVWFKQVRDQAECIHHHGDELVGIKPTLPESIEPIGDKTTPSDTRQDEYHDRQTNQERMGLYLTRIPTHVFHVVMLVANYRGHHLAQAKQGVCQLTDDEGNMITEMNLETLPADCSALWLATLTRSGDGWRFNADKRPLSGHQHDALVKQVHEHLVRTAK